MKGRPVDGIAGRARSRRTPLAAVRYSVATLVRGRRAGPVQSHVPRRALHTAGATNAGTGTAAMPARQRQVRKLLAALAIVLPSVAMSASSVGQGRRTTRMALQYEAGQDDDDGQNEHDHETGEDAHDVPTRGRAVLNHLRSLLGPIG